MAPNQADGLRRLGTGSITALDRPRTRAVAITGGKGGVGKSTVALNLAVSWARRGARTLTVDGDLGMADLNLLLGLAPERSLADVLDGTSIGDVVIGAHGIDLVPALNGSHRLANLDEAARRTLIGAVNGLCEGYETVVVDTPAGIGETAMTLAGSAADVVVVTTPEPLSLADAYACLKVLTMRHGLTRAFVVPNSVRTPSQGEEVVARLQGLVDRFLGITLVPLPAVPWDAAISTAAAAGVPLVIHSPESPAARALRRVAQRLDVLADDGTTQPAHPRLRMGGAR